MNCSRIRCFIVSLILIPISLCAKKQGQDRIDSLVSELPRFVREDTNRAKLLNTISFSYYAYLPDSGLKYGRQGLALAEKLKWKRGIAKAYNAIGANYIAMNSSDLAREYNLKALSINEELGNKRGMADNMGNIGVLYSAENNYPEALNYLFRTLKIFEELGDKQGIATQYINIGTLYQEQKMLDKALKYDTLALNIFRETGEKSSIALQLGNVGNVYSDLGDRKKGFESYTASLKLYEELGSIDGIARNLSNLALYYVVSKEYERALNYHFRVLKLCEQLGDAAMTGSALCNLSTDYLTLLSDSTTVVKPGENIPASLMDRYQLVADYASRSIPYLQQSNSISTLAASYKLLATAQFALKDYKSAYTNYQSYTRFKDSVFSIANNQKINNLEQQREIDLRESKIKILTQDVKLKSLSADKEKLTNRLLIGGIAMILVIGFSTVMYFIRKQRSEKMLANEKINTLLKEQELDSVSNMLEVQEQERKRIADDLHDRLGSMLSTVKLHFNTVEQQIDDLRTQNRDQYQKATTLLDEACDEVRKIAHNLVSGELVKFGLVSALNQLKNTIVETGKLKIQVLDFGIEERLPGATEVSLYRVIQELMNNILKHSKATEVSIQLNKVENNLNIVVEDNGIGYDVGAALAKDGMGLRSMQTRVKKLNGTIEFDSVKGRGSTTIIDIPV